MTAALSGQVFGYGVRRAPFLVDGLPALIAVDAYGTVRKVRKVKPGDDVETIGERLWYWLREHHPERPKLELVPDAPTPPLATVSYRGRQVDPRLLSDPRSPLAKALYVERLAKAAARRAAALPFRPDNI